MTDHERIDNAADIAYNFAGFDGVHHKQWVIDQMLRALLGPDYCAWVARYQEDGEWDWSEGIAP